MSTTSFVNNIKASLSADAEIDTSKMSLETHAWYLNIVKVDDLENKILKESKELNERRERVKFLHGIIKGINNITNSNEGIDFSKHSELKQLIDEAVNYYNDLVDVKKMLYTKEEKERLLDNLRMTIDDLAVQNDVQMQTITRLDYARQEMFQMARSITKPLDEDKKGKARAIRGG